MILMKRAFTSSLKWWIIHLASFITDKRKMPVPDFNNVYDHQIL
jgi:hypothetical protein